MALELPEGSWHLGTICGIDPGTNHLGLSVFIVDLRDYSIVKWDSTSFSTQKLLEEDDLYHSAIDEQMEKNIAQRNNLVRWFKHYEPFAVASEGPFFNRLHPGAYGPLVQCMSYIKEAVTLYHRFVGLNVYQPSIIKKALGAKPTGSGKEPVREAISHIDELMKTLIRPLEELDEHAIDAGGAAYTHLLELRKG